MNTVSLGISAVEAREIAKFRRKTHLLREKILLAVNAGENQATVSYLEDDEIKALQAEGFKTTYFDGNFIVSW